MFRSQVWLRSEGLPAPTPIRLGTALTLDCCSKHAAMGHALRYAYEVFLEWVNEVRGGVLVGGVRRPVEIILIDDLSDAALVANITMDIVDRQGINLLLGPYSSGLTEAAATVAAQLGATMVAPLECPNRAFRLR